ncbi:MAG TPA: signal peptidase II [Candidatus Binataceae bacterium]|nr:signal peptidase II [Candidatus Binataceae bacterium]
MDQAEAMTLAPERKRTGLRPLLTLVCLVTLPVLALDQASKHLVETRLKLYQSFSLIPHWLDLTYTRNPGAAFSLFVNLPLWLRASFLFSLSALAIVALTILLAYSTELNTTSIALALILAGAAGNLIDRATAGEVIDFIDVHYYVHHYPIFNVADCAITIGVALILGASLLTRHTDR